MRRNGYGHDLHVFNHVALIACSISYEKWVQREKWLMKTSESSMVSFPTNPLLLGYETC